MAEEVNLAGIYSLQTPLRINVYCKIFYSLMEHCIVRKMVKFEPKK
jgi:hypothetical protein